MTEIEEAILKWVTVNIYSIFGSKIVFILKGISIYGFIKRNAF